MNSNLVFR